jgi:hypothetical protein
MQHGIPLLAVVLLTDYVIGHVATNLIGGSLLQLGDQELATARNA